jgi:hypothetical protein
MESDLQKLLRIAGTFEPIEIAELLRRGTGIAVPRKPTIALVLAVGVVDCPVPTEVSVFELGNVDTNIWLTEPLVGRF